MAYNNTCSFDLSLGCQNHTFIRKSVSVEVHQGVHGEKVPAHSHHGGEQTLEALERIVEKRANASAPASVR